MQEAATTCHVMHECACNGCGAQILPGEVGIRGTEIGPRLVAIGIKAWKRNASVTGVRDYLSTFGVNFSRGTIQHMLAACARKLEPAAEQIRADLGKSDAVYWDETGASLNGKTGWIWDGVDNGAKANCTVVIHVSASRGRPVPDHVCPNWRRIPATTDGLSVYEAIEER